MNDLYIGRPGRYSLDSGERIPVNPPPEPKPRPKTRRPMNRPQPMRNRRNDHARAQTNPEIWP